MRADAREALNYSLRMSEKGCVLVRRRQWEQRERVEPAELGAASLGRMG